MVNIIWAERAIDDLTNIATDFLKNMHFLIVSKLFNKVDILKKMPKIGRKVPEKNEENIRELIEGNYRII